MRPQLNIADDSAHAFEQGNFTWVLIHGSPDTWQWHASLGLIGRTDEALEGIARFDDPQARFYEGVALWIAGDEIEAKKVLARVPTPHAQQLLSLISKPVVRVLAMMPPGVSGPHLVYRGALSDPKFEIQNILSNQDRSRNPDQFCARAFESAPPDFFVCQMIEWHQIPRSLRSFPCPTIGHTSDFDLHIQGVHGWLSAFDELMVCDHDEHRALAKLTDAPISVFPKAFACPESLPRALRRERAFDVFLSGTLFHPWHPDKARLIHQLFGQEDLRVLGFNGYLAESEYFESLARSRMCVAYYRRDGGMLTRAIESAAMGCVTLVPRGSVVNLYTKPRGALVEYDTSGDGLLRCVKSVLAQYETHDQRAWNAASDFRRELSAGLVGSQYLRFCTYLAAKPRPARSAAAPHETDQRQLVVLKGWLAAGGRLEGMRKLAAENIRLWRRSMRAEPEKRFSALNNIQRERLLVYLRLLANSRLPDWQDKLFDVRRSEFPRPGARARLLNDYRRACAEYPDRLVLIFNYLRAAIHVGSDSELASALKFLSATLARPRTAWQVAPEDDVLSYDIFPLCFNYRRYLDMVCARLAGEQLSNEPLVEMILASLFHYRARLTGSESDARMAATLDPGFPYFALDHGKRLASSKDDDDLVEAGRVLAPLVETSMVASEAWAVLSRLNYAGDTAALAERVRRIEDGLVASEQYLWDPCNILATLQTPHKLGSLGPQLLADVRADRQVRFSVLFVDRGFSNAARYAQLMRAQSAERASYEAIIADAYDQVPADVPESFDKVILCGQNDFLAHDSTVANLAAFEARSNTLLILVGIPDIAASGFEELVSQIEAGGTKVVVSASPGGSVLACDRSTFFGVLGFDENWIYSGSGDIVAALCARLSGAGVEIVSLTGSLPTTGLSRTRQDFLDVAQGRGTSPRHINPLWPRVPNELLRVRARAHDLSRAMRAKPFVEGLPLGYRVPRGALHGPAMIGPPLHLAPGQYRIAWLVEIVGEADPAAPLFDIAVEVDGEMIGTTSARARAQAGQGFLDFAVVGLSPATSLDCKIQISNRSAAGWTMTGIWLQEMERFAPDTLAPKLHQPSPGSPPSQIGNTAAIPAPPSTQPRTRFSYHVAARLAGAWRAFRYGLPPDFDRVAYLRHNPDVAAANVDPVHHFREHGYREGRRWTDD